MSVLMIVSDFAAVFTVFLYSIIWFMLCVFVVCLVDVCGWLWVLLGFWADIVGFPDCAGVGFWDVCLVLFPNSLVGMFLVLFHFHHEILRLLFLLMCGCLFLKSGLVYYFSSEILWCVCGCMNFLSNQSAGMFLVWSIKWCFGAGCNLISSHIGCRICIS